MLLVCHNDHVGRYDIGNVCTDHRSLAHAPAHSLHRGRQRSAERRGVKVWGSPPNGNSAGAPPSSSHHASRPMQPAILRQGPAVLIGGPRFGGTQEHAQPAVHVIPITVDWAGLVVTKIVHAFWQLCSPPTLQPAFGQRRTRKALPPAYPREPSRSDNQQTDDMRKTFESRTRGLDHRVLMDDARGPAASRCSGFQIEQRLTR